MRLIPARYFYVCNCIFGLTIALLALIRLNSNSEQGLVFIGCLQVINGILAIVNSRVERICLVSLFLISIMFVFTPFILGYTNDILLVGLSVINSLTIMLSLIITDFQRTDS